ncbi:MAG: hypothetical protein DRQ49_19280 [Gammaproteobacteria bacterium]|nr:MAG: hypothetical protein DRQ49_19280 [Gammaproteobacteria bacterium]
MKKKKLYLAAPYSDEDEKVMEYRYEEAVKEVGKLMELGYSVICPVVHYHPVAKAANLPRTWDYWQEIDIPLVHCADEVWVFMIKGWKKSIGVNAEIREARKLAKPVRYVDNRDRRIKK